LRLDRSPQISFSTTFAAHLPPTCYFRHQFSTRGDPITTTLPKTDPSRLLSVTLRHSLLNCSPPYSR
jgi:hypothetical protein